MKKPWYKIKALNPLTAEIRVYGVISKEEVNPNEFITSLKDLESKYRTINVRLNCEGGDVFGGFAMYNAMKSSTANIDTYNDGLAASMGSILLQGANRKRYMAKNARVMTHPPSGAACGSSADLRSIADVMDSLESEMRSVYKSATKQDDTVIDSWMQQGKDNWFNASQALQAKLVDEVIDPAAVLDESVLAGLSSAAIVAKFNEKLISENNMDKSLLIVALGLTAGASDADIIAALQTLTNKVKTLETEKANLTAELTAQKAVSIDSMLITAKDQGKISAEQIPSFKVLAELNFEACKKAIDSIQPVAVLPSAVIMGKGGAGGSTGDVRANWTFSDWMQKDSAGLEALEKSDPNKFRAIYKAQFNAEPDLGK